MLNSSGVHSILDLEAVIVSSNEQKLQMKNKWNQP